MKMMPDTSACRGKLIWMQRAAIVLLLIFLIILAEAAHGQRDVARITLSRLATVERERDDFRQGQARAQADLDQERGKLVQAMADLTKLRNTPAPMCEAEAPGHDTPIFGRW